MSIVKMKRLRLVAMGADRDEILRQLQRMGCVEITEVPMDQLESGAPPGENEDELLRQLAAQLKRPDGGALSAAREHRTAVERALEVLRQYAPAKGGLLQPRPELTEGELFDAERTRVAAAQAEEINSADRRVHTIQAEMAKLEAQKAVLLPWQDLDLPLETESTEQVTIQLGTLPGPVPFAQAEGAVLAESELAQLTLISADREQQYCLLVCHSEQSEAVLEALKDQGWSKANLREWTGTARENSEGLERQLERLSEERSELEKKLAGMGPLRADLQRLADRTAAEVSREESIGRTWDTGKTFYLEGWVSAEQWPKLEQLMSAYPCAMEAADPTEEEYPDVPVKLKNNWFTRPLNMVTEMYSLPAYGSLDPNPLMAPFFILFYGIMMADMGYGLLMMLASAIVLMKKKPTGTMSHFFGLMGLCGVSTFLMGALTGGFFGDFLTQIVKLTTGGDFALPALFTPLEDTMMILIGAMCLGFVQIVTGMAISFVKKLKEGQVMDAVFEEVTWWVVFAGLALAILGKTSLVIILGGVLVVAGPLITGKGAGKITGIFGSLYNHVTGYFGDILSYSRLMALMLAGSVIAQVFNTLGAIPGNIVIFILISAVGNALNFALNLLGCYVHDLRLQCLEYFGKFYQDGGRPFRPLDLSTKYYNVVK